MSFGQARHTIEVADQTLTFRSVSIEDLTPTGAQLAATAGFKHAKQVAVLHILANGGWRTSSQMRRSTFATATAVSSSWRSTGSIGSPSMANGSTGHAG